MDNQEMSAETAIRLLREVVAGREEFTYQPPDGDLCVYRASDCSPSCLVGCVLDRWQPGIEMPEEESVGQSSFLPGRLSDDAREVLDVAQRRQDSGSTWGEALREAEERYAA